MKGLLIRTPWIDKILAGEKIWEIRGSKTHIRERIALIRAGSGKIVGTCDLVNSIGPLTIQELKENCRKAGFDADSVKSLPYKRTYAWVLKDAVRLKNERRYHHPSGAVIWVNITDF